MVDFCGFGVVLPSKAFPPLLVCHASLRAAVAGGLDAEALVPVMQGFITEQLKEEFINANDTIAGVMGYVDDGNDAFLADVPWFAAHFPKDLLMRNVVGAHDALKALL